MKCHIPEDPAFSNLYILILFKANLVVVTINELVQISKIKKSHFHGLTLEAQACFTFKSFYEFISIIVVLKRLR